MKTTRDILKQIWRETAPPPSPRRAARLLARVIKNTGGMDSATRLLSDVRRLTTALSTSATTTARCTAAATADDCDEGQTLTKPPHVRFRTAVLDDTLADNDRVACNGDDPVVFHRVGDLRTAARQDASFNDASIPDRHIGDSIMSNDNSCVPPDPYQRDLLVLQQRTKATEHESYESKFKVERLRQLEEEYARAANVEPIRTLSATELSEFVPPNPYEHDLKVLRAKEARERDRRR